MSNTKISALSSATTPLSGSEIVPINQSGVTDSVTVANLTAGRSVSASNFVPTDSSIPTNGLFLPAANTVGIATNNSERVRFDANGNGGLQTTPSAWAWPNGSTGAWQLQSYAALSGYNSTTYLSQNWYYNAGEKFMANGYAHRYQQTSGTHAWLISTASNSSGAGASVTWNTVWVMNSSGNLVQGIANSGINFTANTPASGMTSQNLTWYEEGTWTPVLSATTTAPTVSYANRTALYTRVGRLVTIHLWMNISSQSGGSGNVTITGLPFTSGNTGGAPVAAVTVGLYQNINPGVGLILTPYITNNSSVINLAGSTQTGSGWSNLTTTALGASNINLQLTATYLC